MTPFKVISPQLDTASASQHLWRFAGVPPWYLEEASKLLRSAIQTQNNFNHAPPSWSTFKHALKQPKHKAAGYDHIAPHLVPMAPP